MLHLIVRAGKKRRRSCCKNFLESDETDYNRNNFSFQLQGREDVES